MLLDRQFTVCQWGYLRRLGIERYNVNEASVVEKKRPRRIQDHSRLAIKCSRICSVFDQGVWFLSKCSTFQRSVFKKNLVVLLCFVADAVVVDVVLRFFFLSFANFWVFCTRWAISNLYHLLIHLQNLLLPISLLSRWYLHRDTRTL